MPSPNSATAAPASAPASAPPPLRAAVDQLNGSAAAAARDQAGPWTPPDPDGVVLAVEQWAQGQGLSLYPHQDAALLELVTGANVILGTPTGTGKSLVAMGAHAAALSAGRRTFYTAPIKALVNEKFFALCEVFGADLVGMMTGDAQVNPGAPVICCTAEVLANIALRHGADAAVDQVVMDEFHYYADPDRGWAWQVPLLELPNAQFLLMSATLGDVSFFATDLRTRTGRASTVIDDAPRPVPLDYAYVHTTVQETIASLLAAGRGPIYVVGFTQAEAMERAQALTSTLKLSGKRKEMIAARIADERLRTAFGKNLSRYLRHGVGVHHAGMLPRYRRFVERLAQAGLLDVICGTDTLGVGINVPIRTVLFTALGKYDGHSTRHLSAREFHQIAGRAGRAGFDTHGSVVAQAPEHEVLNAKAVAKAGKDAKKARKVTRKGPAPGSVSWKEGTFDRLRTSAPEPLTSQFAVSHAMVLNVLARPGDPFQAMRQLLRGSHEPRSRQNRHIRDAIAAFRALEAVGVARRASGPDGQGRTAALTVDLPDDFALNQALSTFALAALEALDPDSPQYALDVVSVVEATLEDPRPIVRAQRDRARGEAVAQMKADGIEYEERMALLEDVGHPQPLRDLLDVAYDAYRRSHPWVLDHQLKPKSVIREMLEQGMGFADLIQTYGLARSEGAALRYLSDGYRALRAGVPPGARTHEVDEIVAWLGEVVRQTDSSLLQEWERLTDPEAPGRHEDPAIRPEQPRGVTGNPQAFRVMVRNAMFRLVRLAARERYEDLAALPWAPAWSVDRWAEALDAYWDEYDQIDTGPDARGPRLFMVDTAPPADVVAQAPHRPAAGLAGARARFWSVRQILADPKGHHDWAITAVVDLDASDEAGEPMLAVIEVG